MKDKKIPEPREAITRVVGYDEYVWAEHYKNLHELAANLADAIEEYFADDFESNPNSTLKALQQFRRAQGVK